MIKTEKQTERENLILQQRWKALCLRFRTKGDMLEYFGAEQNDFRWVDSKEVPPRFMVDMMEYILSSAERRKMDFKSYRKTQREFEKIEIYVTTPHLSNRERKLKDIFCEYRRGIPYPDLLEKYGPDLMESMCEMFNVAKS